MELISTGGPRATQPWLRTGASSAVNMIKFAKSLVVVGSAVLFALMWGVLIGQHALKGEGESARLDYGRLLKEGEQIRERTHGIYFLENRLGSTHTVVKRYDSGEIVLRNDTCVNLGEGARYVAGLSGELDVSFSARFSPLQGLLGLIVRSKALGFHLVGVPVNEMLMIRGRLGDRGIKTAVPLVREEIFGGIFVPLGGLPDLSEAELGRTWTIHLVNPIRGELEKVTISMEGAKLVEVDGERLQVFKLVFSARRSEWDCWVGQDGEVLIQGTPFGLTLRREDIPQSILRDIMTEGFERYVGTRKRK